MSLASNPSEQFTAMYKDILKSTNGVEFDLNVEKSGWMKRGGKRRFYCKFEVFKDYQLKARAAGELGRVVNVCLSP